MVDAAAYEFAETEDFIKAGEDLLGPYVWDRAQFFLSRVYKLSEQILASLVC